ncbi:DoxX family protein [Nocardia sp. NPDC049707]|uniref:DoxX family protein n=1 Tax=Nocardia sp. NPDC049707 TaxID=3154735 RepID=UPI00343B56BB
MFEFPDLLWPVLVLAFIQFGDAIMCIKPFQFIADCFEGVNWPRRFWWVMSPIKFAAGAGLILGLWVPYLTAVTCAALVLYFLIAIGMHVAAQDFGRNLFLNAAAMFVICVGAAVLAFPT